MFPLSLYRPESSTEQHALYKTLLVIRILRKTVRQEQMQDTKSTTNQTSMFTTKWMSIFINQNTVFFLFLPISNWKFRQTAFLCNSALNNLTTRAIAVFKSIHPIWVVIKSPPSRTGRGVKYFHKTNLSYKSIINYELNITNLLLSSPQILDTEVFNITNTPFNQQI